MYAYAEFTLHVNVICMKQRGLNNLIKRAHAQNIMWTYLVVSCYMCVWQRDCRRSRGWQCFSDRAHAQNIMWTYLIVSCYMCVWQRDCRRSRGWQCFSDRAHVRWADVADTNTTNVTRGGGQRVPNAFCLISKLISVSLSSSSDVVGRECLMPFV